MAIFYCDPYIETTAGSWDDSTYTTTGNGTWAEPWSLTDLEGLTDANFTNGDELRFKGRVSENDHFDPADSSGSTTDNNFYVNTGDNYYVFRYTNVYGDTVFWNTGVQTQSRSINNPASYYGIMPQWSNANYEPLKTNLRITNSKNYQLLGTNFTKTITITAGWVSTTAQTGMTIISSNGSFSLGTNTSSYVASGGGHEITIDAKTNLIWHSGAQTTRYWGFKDLKMKSFHASGYGSQTMWYKFYGNNFDCESFFTGGGTCQFYFYGDGAINFAAKYLLNGSGLGVVDDYFLENNNTYNTSQQYSFSIQYSICGYYIQFDWNGSDRQSGSGDSLDWEWTANHQYTSANSSTSAIMIHCNQNSNITESFTGSASTVTSHLTATNPTDSLNKIDPNGIVDNSSSGLNYLYDVTVRDTNFAFHEDSARDVVSSGLGWKRLLNGTTTLENLTNCSIRSNSLPSPYANAAKSMILYDEQGDRPLQILWPHTNYGVCAYVYNSTEFSNEMVWHFTKRCAESGASFSDTFYHNCPDYTSASLTYAATYQRSASADLTVSIKLYAYSPIGGGEVKLLRTFTPTWTTNQYAISETLTTAELSEIYASALYTIVECTPNDTVNATKLMIPETTVT